MQNAKLYQLEQQRLQELDKAHAELADLNTNLEKKVEDRTKELVALSEKLAKYFSPQVYDSIFSGELDVKIQTQRKPLTVFFCDLQGFTQLTERLEPGDTNGTFNSIPDGNVQDCYSLGRDY